MFISPILRLAILEMIDHAESNNDWSELDTALEWTLGDVLDAIHADVVAVEAA